MMKKRWGALLAAGLVATVSGCDALLDLIGANSVTIVVVNLSDTFGVEATFSYSDTQEIPEALLLEFGDQVEFTVAAGTTRTFTRSCDELQAIILEDADLLVIGQAGPQTDTGILRDGDDFGCGDTITFTFTHSDLLLDFDVGVSVQ